jgi:hypothetical protein
MELLPVTDGSGTLKKGQVLHRSLRFILLAAVRHGEVPPQSVTETVVTETVETADASPDQPPGISPKAGDWNAAEPPKVNPIVFLDRVALPAVCRMS